MSVFNRFSSNACGMGTGKPGEAQSQDRWGGLVVIGCGMIAMMWCVGYEVEAPQHNAC